MKLVASLVASSALAISMLVAVPSTATAAPYPGTVATRCSYVVPGSVRKNRELFVRYRVRASGNARPAGVVKIRVYKIAKDGSKHLKRVFSQRYRGPNFKRTSLGTFKKKGRYSTKMWFRPRKGSVYKSCHSGSRYFKVKKKKR